MDRCVRQPRCARQTLLERPVPLLPSKVLLVAIGIAVAEGLWSLHTTLQTSTAGSLLSR